MSEVHHSPIDPCAEETIFGAPRTSSPANPSFLTGNGGEYYKGWDIARLCQKLSRGVWAIGEAVKHIARPSKPMNNQSAVDAYVLDLRKAANYLTHAADEIEAGITPDLEVAS